MSQQTKFQMEPTETYIIYLLNKINVLNNTLNTIIKENEDIKTENTTLVRELLDLKTKLIETSSDE